MGREIRRVPPNWEHPKDGNNYVGLFDGINYEFEAQDWVDNNDLWMNGLHPEQTDEKYYFNVCEPPLRDDYTEVKPDECTWYQVYETVSEGTPVTPPFETKEELINYLVEFGDFWQQKAIENRWTSDLTLGWSREAATAFVNGPGWVPSCIVTQGKLFNSIDCAAI